MLMLVGMGCARGLSVDSKTRLRGGWQWQNTRIDDPQRAERQWLAIAVATLWVVSVGAFADAKADVPNFEQLPPSHVARRRSQQPNPPRRLSCFCLGLIVIVSALMNRCSLPLGSFHPQPWPCSTVTIAPAPT